VREKDVESEAYRLYLHRYFWFFAYEYLDFVTSGASYMSIPIFGESNELLVELVHT